LNIISVRNPSREKGVGEMMMENCVTISSRVTTEPIKIVGFHYILELHGVDPKTLKDLEFLKEALQQAALAAGATIIFVNFHSFLATTSEPEGVTGVVGVSESHLSIHTWPEYGYAAVDIFLCCDEGMVRIQPQKAIDLIKEKFKPTKINILELSRGPEVKHIIPA